MTLDKLKKSYADKINQYNEKAQIAQLNNMGELYDEYQSTASIFTVMLNDLNKIDDGKSKWIERPSPCKTYQYGTDPELIHIIKTGFKDNYMVVHEDACKLELGDVEFHTKSSIKKTYNIDI